MSIIERALEKAADGAEEQDEARRRPATKPVPTLADAVPLDPALDRAPEPPSEPAQPRPLVAPGVEGAAGEPDLPSFSASRDLAEEPLDAVTLGAGVEAADEPQPPGESERIDLDVARLSRAAIITPDQPEGLLAEQFRMVKRPLLMRAAADRLHDVRNANLILVTSSVPGEGKTFTSTNLAMSIAMEHDRTVLLIDADVHRSGVSQILGVDGRPGLTEHLLGEEPDLSRLLLRTNVDTLSVLPSGRRVENVPELFSSQDTQRLLGELASRYEDRIVIIDSPPLLATTDAAALAHHVGQVVMVVEAVRTPQSAVKEALSRLQASDNVSIMLNKSRQRLSAAHRYGRYGKGYGYGYGYGYGDRAAAD